ncbi:unnamed protein product [Arctia plantaginis]|uniref:Endonuclease/exonuclease/phosphatase domain-containing protein n=1 Tax=Arctia plantaginis TaxID=874455 RepID=A0A8S1ATE2_ARCPL|nr:unnamed protein product [Arctia plantaginis]
MLPHTECRVYRGVRVFQNTGQGGGTVKAAMAVFDPNLDVVQYPQLTTDNIVVVGIRTSAWMITLVSFYFEPTEPVGPYLERLKYIRRKIGSQRIVLGGDANAKSTRWGSRIEDSRGEAFSGALGEMDLHVLNSGNIPNFDTVRGGVRYCSYVDVTACTSDVIAWIDGWRVDEGLVSSDHNGIVFNINLNRAKGINIKRTTRKYNTKKANWDGFQVQLTRLIAENNIKPEDATNTHELESIAEKYSRLVGEACDQNIPKKKSSELFTMPWWSERLTILKRRLPPEDAESGVQRRSEESG